MLAGSVLLHVGVKWIEITAGWGSTSRKPRRPHRGPREAAPRAEGTSAGLSRRGLLVGVAAGIGLVAVTTVGETLRPLRALDLLGPRRPTSARKNCRSTEGARAGVRAAATTPGIG